MISEEDQALVNRNPNDQTELENDTTPLDEEEARFTALAHAPCDILD